MERNENRGAIERERKEFGDQSLIEARMGTKRERSRLTACIKRMKRLIGKGQPSAHRTNATPLSL